MMRPRCAAKLAALLAAPFASAACARSEGAPSLSSVAPSAAYNDDPLALTIAASAAFRPAFRIETSSGTVDHDVSEFSVVLDPAPPALASPALPRVPATGISLPDPAHLLAAFPAQIAAGLYDVVVVDPRGTRLVEPSAFRSLGSDHDPPSVSIVSPAEETLVGADTDVTVTFTADDGAGHLSLLGWTVSRDGSPETLATEACALNGTPSRADCMFSFPAPSPMSTGDRLSIFVQATDTRGNTGTAQVFVDLARRPIVTGFSPDAGPISGGTPVTAEGTDFIPGSTKIFLGDTPLVTSVKPDGTVATASTVPHDQGQVAVTVRTAGASTSAGHFQFIAPPIVRQLIPASGFPGGGTPVSIVGDNLRNATTITFAAADGPGAKLLCPTFRGPSRIDGFAPPGVGVVAIVAIDPIGGAGRLADGFAYDDASDPGLPNPDSCPDGGSSP